MSEEEWAKVVPRKFTKDELRCMADHIRDLWNAPTKTLTKRELRRHLGYLLEHLAAEV